MSEQNQFDWVDFYKELSGKLLQYKDNREELIEKVRKIYEITGINLPTLEKDNQIIDIDPFTFFGLFNKKLTDANRLSILKAIAELFDVKAPVPTAFDSIPVLNPQNATFYYFIPDRGDDDIQDLWELFNAALAYAKDPSPETIAKVSKYFDLCINKKGNGNSKITMGLYWIAPNSLLNLDQRNTWYIYESGKIPEELVKTLPEIEAKIPSDKYFDIVEKLRAYLHSDASQLKDFKELSFEAWRYSEQVNQEQAAAKKVEAQRENKGAAIADEGVETVHYWIYAPGDGAMYWDEFYSAGIMGIGWDDIGDLSAYNTKSEMRKAMQEKIDPSRSFKNDAHATWQFVNEMKPGDIIFAKKGMHQVIGRGVVGSDYEFDPQRDHYKNIRQVKWTHKGEWQHPGQAVMKTLTDITAYTDYVEKLNSLFESEIEDDIEEPVEIDLKPYDADMFLEEVYMDKNKYIEGTGLGLSIVKQFVDLMGGKITVNSVYTKGTTFIIEIPQKIIVDEPVGEFDVLSRKRASEEHIYVQSFEAPDAKVLVVDDTSANLMVVSKLLRDTRINLELVSSGKEALDKTLENFYHVILMDHKMPGMDGIECMHAIRAQVGGQCQDSKIIALTANAGSDTKEMYFREGFDGYLKEEKEDQSDDRQCCGHSGRVP